MVVIRTAHPDELPVVGRVTYEGFGHGSGTRREPDPDRLALLLDAAARAAGGDLLVALDDMGTIIGTASLLRADSPLSRQAVAGEAELRLLAVLPAARRMGAGLALMVEAIRRAEAWGAGALVLDTGPNNVRSQRLYHSLGFDRVPERETQISSSGAPLAVFRYPLDDPHGLVVRLSSGESRAGAVKFWSRATSRAPNPLRQPAPSCPALDEVDVWRVEDRSRTRLHAVALTHRLRFPDDDGSSDDGSPDDGSSSSGSSDDTVAPASVLAAVENPIAIDPAADAAAVGSTVSRLSKVLAHGGLTIAQRQRADASPIHG